MAYADSPEGPWKEYEANPLIAREWAPHYKVSHVSGPHAIWIEEERRLLGVDPWPNGFKQNRANLERFIGYASDQGLLQRKLSVEELFVEATLDT